MVEGRVRFPVDITAVCCQTKPDQTMGGCALTPALGDANWEQVWEAMLGWAAGAYAKTDPWCAAALRQ